MPRIVPIMPSKDEAKLKASFEQIMAAAAAVNLPLDLKGLAQTWLSDTAHLAVAYEGDTPTAIGFMVSGRRWFDDEPAASVLFCQGPDEAQVLEYLKSTAIIMGAHKMFYEGDSLGGEIANLRMLRLRD